MPNKKLISSRWLLLVLLSLTLFTSCKESQVNGDGFQGRKDPTKSAFGYFYFFANDPSGTPELRAIVRRDKDGTARVSSTDLSQVLENIDVSRLKIYNDFVIVIDGKYAGIQFAEKPATVTFVLGPICESGDDGQDPLELAILLNADSTQAAAIYSSTAAMKQVPVVQSGPSAFNYTSPEFTSVVVSKTVDVTHALVTAPGEDPGTTHYMNFVSPMYGTRELTCLLPVAYPK